jgi:hypothetical protein
MHERSSVYRKCSLTAFLLAAIMSTAHAETSIGRWCDEAIPTLPQYNSILEIVISDGGAIELRIRNGDGTRTVTALSELGGGIYEVTGSSTGAKYRVEPDGSLALLNYEGFARLAIRLGDTPKSGDCGI